MSFKSVFKKTISKLKSKVVITTIGLICLALLIWFGGPLIAIAGHEPLLSTTSRLATLLVIAVCWGGFHFIKRFKDNKHNEKLVNTMINGDEQQQNRNDDAVKKEIDKLQQRMVQAHDILKHAKFVNNKSLYELPWYIMIGPPGSGKTTAIQHSGLEYPLKEKMGVDMIQGVGGTRNCDWWFTNKAVLIDTAGRYTTHDSNKKQDSRAWQGFLGLLKKHRPVRPINGIIISMGLSDLLSQTKTERNLHARAIKQRLQELQNQLGMTFPVYVLLSKCDLIAGFSEFFDYLDKEDCDQIWGVTFPLAVENDESIVSQFNKQFHALLSNLNDKVNSRLKNERNIERRRVIYEFPKQLRLLQSAADDFLKEIFSPNSYEMAPMLRGVYLTSATQEGMPIDKLSSELLSSNRTAVAADHNAPTRSYFIKHLLEDVIFPEKDLATTNKHHDKQHSILSRSVMIIASLVTIGCSAAWWQSYNWNRDLVDNTQTALAKYSEISPQDLQDQDGIIKINNSLSVLSHLPVGFANEPTSDEKHTWGLYQGDKLKEPAVEAYKRALKAYYAPYLSTILIHEMSVNNKNLNYLYLTLKTYLMLYQPEHYAAEDVKAWFSVYFDRKLLGDVNENVRAELNQHLATMLELGIRGQDVDKQVIRDSREKLSQLTLVERAYQRLKSDYIPSNIPDFKLGNIISLDGLSAFRYLSGKNIYETIPGLYTFNGFHGIFNIEKKRIVKSLVEDSWVYGEDQNTLNSLNEEQITKQLENKYYQDYIFYWRNFIDDLVLQPFNNDADAYQIIHEVSNAESPFKNIILAVIKNVKLTEVPVSKNTKAALGAAANASEQLLNAKKSRITRLLPRDKLDLEVNLPGKEVELAFSDLLNLNIDTIDKAQETLVKLDRAIGKKQLSRTRSYGFSEDELEIDYANIGRDLNDQVTEVPDSIRGWYDSILTWLGRKVVVEKQIRLSDAKKDLNSLWKTEVLSQCKSSILGRYPFKTNTTDVVSMKDFNQFFGYGGTLDTFFNENLKDFVNTKKNPWVFSENIGLNAEVLKVFQSGTTIRRTFFENGSRSAQIYFGLKPLYLDRHISHFKLSINGQELNYRHDPIRTTQFSWPGTGAPETRIVFTLPNGGRSITKQFVGDWSLFRFLDYLATKRPATKQDNELNISFGNGTAKVLLSPGSSNNPFWKRNLVRFTCPSQL
ncbi:type VI secretion system membrane subunit TssM [Psychromonas sp. PT13]|uniref:type VI secretion system membrane subunit TssM n=1 Tax=Psychromonas sp. PT13 TaxID=3439547 RepID=UPI003EBDF4DA